MPALPDQGSQEYFALRRLWADHTMNTARRGRGYYWWGTEDNMTPVLFQNWAVVGNPEAFAPLLAACGHRTRGLQDVRWAYACEEAIEVGAFAGVEGRFLIPDIVLHFRDAAGPGLVAFEVKRPGVLPTEKDAAKLRAYTRLGSMRGIDRKTGCFLVGASAVEEARRLSADAPCLSWNDMLEFQTTAFGPEFPAGIDWLRRIYALQGIGSAPAPAPLAGIQHGCAQSRLAIRGMGLSDRQERFLLGAEAVEAFLAGTTTEPPLAWLADAPTREDFSKAKSQSTSARRLCRWGETWNARREQ